MFYQINPKNIKATNLILFFFFSTLFSLRAEVRQNVIITPPTSKSIFDLMSYKEVLDVELRFDINKLIENRRSNDQFLALLSFEDERGATQEWNIKVGVRGKFRRVKCTEMPPLKLDFSKKELERNGLLKFDDMKLVTLCMANNKLDQSYLLKEYLGYKLYNKLTSASYRVQLLRIHYIDQKTGKRKKQMGFVIEDTAQLRARIEAEKIEERNIIDSDRFQKQHRRMTAVFQYMIGNADWEIHKSRNTKYVVKDGKIITIPYDFDFSALVSPGYASISSRYGQKSFKDRVYLGFEKTQTELDETLKFYESKRSELLHVIDDFKLLPSKDRKEMIAYLIGFFDESHSINFANETLSFNHLD